MGLADDLQEKHVMADDNQSDAVSASDEESVTDNENQDEYNKSNLAWSDSLANILKTKRRDGKKVLVLSKAKKIANVIKKKKIIAAGFDVATESGEIKPEHVEIEVKGEQMPKKLKIDILSVRVKPNVLERDRERMLMKIATKGVVQLFNAVRMQQKDISAKISEAGPLEARRENALKNIDKKNFLNVLMGKKSESVIEENVDSNKSIADSSWNILTDEYMMSAKLKDWDRELNMEVEAE